MVAVGFLGVGLGFRVVSFVGEGGVGRVSWVDGVLVSGSNLWCLELVLLTGKAFSVVVQEFRSWGLVSNSWGVISVARVGFRAW